MALLGFSGPLLGGRDPTTLAPPNGRNGAAAHACSVVRDGPESFCTAPWTYQEGGISVGLKGSPVWHGGGAELTQEPNPAKAVLQAYRRWGRDLLQHLHGAFAIALIDRPRGSVLLAIDRMGIERLAYHVAGESIVFSTSAEQAARLASGTARVRPQAVYDYLFEHMVPAPETVFDGVRKLRAATVAVFEGGQLRIEPYWRPHFVDDGADARFEDLKAGLHSSLRAAVRDCAPDGTTGAFLSGGLDSSTVAGLLGEVTGSPAQTFSIGFGVDAFDELRYARIASTHFGTRAHEYHVTPEDIVSVFDEVAAAYDEPFGNSSAVPTLMCARYAVQHGMTHLLAGDGGDELFGGNARYARQSMFEAYYRIPRFLRIGLIEPLASCIPQEVGLAPLRKVRSYVDQARVPLPERLETWNFMFRTDVSQMLEPEFLAAVDTRGPMRLMQEVYDSAPTTSVLNRLLYYDWYFTLADNDLRKVSTMCELAGIRVSFPMLDTRVVELSTRVPPHLKMRGTELRTFYKRATRGFLPEEILRKQKHGFGLPFGVWLKTHDGLRELIGGHLESLKRRGIVRPGFIDDLVRSHRDGHAGFFGYPIWDLAMLDAWLGAHGVSL